MLAHPMRGAEVPAARTGMCGGWTWTVAGGEGESVNKHGRAHSLVGFVPHKCLISTGVKTFRTADVYTIYRPLRGVRVSIGIPEAAQASNMSKIDAAFKVQS